MPSQHLQAKLQEPDSLTSKQLLS